MSVRLSASRTRWLLRFPARPDARIRLVCVPGAGSRASMFHPWSATLPATVEICGVQLPGRAARGREPSFTRMAPLADALADELRHWQDIPMVLLGHSLGSVIAFETARRLVDVPGHRLAALVVAAHKAPQLGSADTPVPPHRLGEADLVEFVRGLGGTPDEVLAQPDVVRLMLPALRADLELDHTYRYQPGPPLDLPVHVFGGTSDPLVSADELAAWQAQTTRNATVRRFPGDHFFLTGDSGPALLADLAAILRHPH